MKTKRILSLIIIASVVACFPVKSSIAATGALWTRHFSDNYFMSTSMTSTPVFSPEKSTADNDVANDRTNNNHDMVYIVNKDVLYALNTLDGSIISQHALSRRMNSVCDPVIKDERLYIPLSDGVIECVDTSTMETLWTSESLSEKFDVAFQTLGRLSMTGNYLFAGTWATLPASTSNVDSDVKSQGVFFCIDALTGQTIWSYEGSAGFYWTQAVTAHDRVFFTSEDGTLISHAIDSDKVYETASLTDGKQIRCGLAITEDAKSIFTVSKTGQMIRIRLSADGKINGIDKDKLIPEAGDNDYINATSTPAIFGDRLFVGCFHAGYGKICVWDTKDFTSIYTVIGPANGEIKSRPLIITSPMSIFFTANENTGSLYSLDYDIQKDEPGEIKTFFTPYKDKQYCIANPVIHNGILFYSNDSGTLFALGETDHSADVPYEVDKPYSVKYKKSSKKITVSWKNKHSYEKTKIYIKIGSKKWKLLKNTSAKKYSFKTKKYKNKKIKLKLKNYYLDYESPYTTVKTFKL